MTWVKRLFHPIPIFPSYCICEGFRDKMPEIIGASFDYFKNINGHMYIHEETNQKLTNYLKKRIDEDERYLERLLEEVHTASQQLIDAAKKSSQSDFRTKSQLELIEALEEFIGGFENLTPYLPVTNNCIAILESMVRDELSQKVKDARLLNNYMLTLMSPSEYTAVGRFYIEILKLAIKANKDHRTRTALQKSQNLQETEAALRECNREVWEETKKLVKNFTWVNLDFGFGKLLTFEDVLQKLLWLIKNCAPDLKLQDFRKRKVKTKREKRRILNNYLSDRTRRRAELMNAFIVARQARFEVFNIAGAICRSLFEEIATRIGLSFDQLSYLTSIEIKNILRDQQIPRAQMKELIAERQKGYAMVTEKGEIKLLTGKQIETVAEEEAVPLVSEVTGRIAMRGVVIGKASLILDKRNFSKVNEGDVLVTIATTPAYTVILDKVAAIVADVGGVTSHAALVAREMGIPCLTATKFGTKIFRDGDILEVNAEKGIARRL